MWFLWAGLLLLLAVALVLVPFVRRKSQVRHERARVVKAIYTSRLEELTAEVDAGQLAANAREELEAELGAALLEDFKETESAPSTTAESSRFAWVVLAVIVPIFSAWIYWTLGDPGALAIEGAEVVLRLDAGEDRTVLEGWQARLDARTEARADDAQSWYLLAHTEMKLGNFQRAAEGFAAARRLHGEDPNIDIYWLQARYLAADGRIDAESADIARRILEQAPNQPMVLEMFAIDAYRRGDFKTAVTFLNRALSNPLDPQQRALLQAGLGQAREALGDLTPSIDVAVDVVGEPPHGATLFVIARPVGGGMPFAVVKRPGASFPVNVRLDEAVSMNPAVGLTAAEEIEVVVRLSQSGAPMAQAGDWEWRSAPVAVTALDTPETLSATLSAP